MFSTNQGTPQDYSSKSCRSYRILFHGPLGFIQQIHDFERRLPNGGKKVQLHSSTIVTRLQDVVQRTKKSHQHLNVG